MQLLDKDNQDSLQREMKLLRNPSPELVQTLESETFSTILSPVFEAGPSAGFKNVYAFINKNEDGVYRFTYVLVNRRSSSMFPVNMTIVDVQNDHIDLVHGPSDSLRTYTLISSQGPLF
ncbi:hypothetical protein D3C87_1565390 [compost metagenome]